MLTCSWPHGEPGLQGAAYALMVFLMLALMSGMFVFEGSLLRTFLPYCRARQGRWFASPMSQRVRH